MVEPAPTATQRAQAYLDGAFAERAADGAYRTFEPIHGFGCRDAFCNQAVRIARTARILRILSGETFGELLDVGSGEGYTADLVTGLLGVRAVACDLSREGCLRGVERFGLPSVAANAAVLPFGDATFDAVLCSEVIEHVEDPFRVLSELMRVARRFVLVTTAECVRSEWARRLHLKLRDFDIPHVEANWWLPADFTALLGPAAVPQRQLRDYAAPPDTETNLAAVRAWLDRSVAEDRLEREGTGVFVLWRCPGAPPSAAPRRPPLAYGALWDTLLAPRPTGKPSDPAQTAWLASLIRCPLCHGGLDRNGDQLSCPSCARQWSVYGGQVPDLTLAGTEAAALSAPGLDPVAVRRLRHLFRPANVWTGWRRAVGPALLSLAEAPGDLRAGHPLRPVLRRTRAALRQAWRALTPGADGRVVRPRGSDRIYLIERGRKRHIAGYQVFLGLGFSLDRVTRVDPVWLDRIPTGDPIDAVPGEP